jgi:hypothetical protein
LSNCNDWQEIAVVHRRGISTPRFVAGLRRLNVSIVIRLAASHWRTVNLRQDNGFSFRSAWHPHRIGAPRHSFTPLTARDRAKQSSIARHGRALGFLPRPF